MLSFAVRSPNQTFSGVVGGRRICVLGCCCSTNLYGAVLHCSVKFMLRGRAGARDCTECLSAMMSCVVDLWVHCGSHMTPGDLALQAQGAAPCRDAVSVTLDVMIVHGNC
jgi:hypothetical protein